MFLAIRSYSNNYSFDYNWICALKITNSYSFDPINEGCWCDFCLIRCEITGIFGYSNNWSNIYMHNPWSDMIAFEEKVISFQKENEEVQRVIVRGTDEHLDFLLRIKKKLESLTGNFSELMNDIIPGSNNLTNEQVTAAIPSLLDLYSSSIKLVAALKRSKVANDLKTCCQEYYSQVENLRELISDLEHYRTSNDFDSILEELNSF